MSAVASDLDTEPLSRTETEAIVQLARIVQPRLRLAAAQWLEENMSSGALHIPATQDFRRIVEQAAQGGPFDDCVKCLANVHHAGEMVRNRRAGMLLRGVNHILEGACLT